MRLALAGALLLLSTLAHAETVRLYAAGSLKAALTEIVWAFEYAKGGSVRVETTFGPSGLLRERIEKGEVAHIFASADMSHPQRLADQGRSTGPVRIFARNELCALARADLSVTSDSLLDVMLAPHVRLGTSTPKADPSGDYAFALFAKAERLKPGARAMLESKALLLTGGADSEKVPAGRNQYAWVMESGKADLFLTYCTNARLALRELPKLRIVPVPADLNVVADYGMILLNGAPQPAADLARLMLNEFGQTFLLTHGFARGDPVQ